MYGVFQCFFFGFKSKLLQEVYGEYFLVIFFVILERTVIRWFFQLSYRVKFNSVEHRVQSWKKDR